MDRIPWIFNQKREEDKEIKGETASTRKPPRRDGEREREREKERERERETKRDKERDKEIKEQANESRFYCLKQKIKVSRVILLCKCNLLCSL